MKRWNIRWQLVIYDLIMFSGLAFVLLFLRQSTEPLTFRCALSQSVLSAVCIFTARIVGRVYQQIWRYGGIQCYIRLLVVDACAFLVNFVLERLLPIDHISVTRLLSICSMNLLCVLATRMVYRYAYKCGNNATRWGRFLNRMILLFAGKKIVSEKMEEKSRIKLAIIGAGRLGISLAEELCANPSAMYLPVCFVDTNRNKADRETHGIPVLMESENTLEQLRDLEVQEVVFTIPNLSAKRQKKLYERYLQGGFKVKVYDYPVAQTSGGKRHVRDFDIDELLFRKPVVMHDDKTSEYYRDKVVLITGGGGSIGSELCRQLAKMQVRELVILDICENGAYDVQQDMLFSHKAEVKISVEIVSICNKRAMERVFKKYGPQIVINAAAHKHVPLMENNCIEAVENNVFGTQVLIELCEEYGAERFMMVSTDKAVNPTNVMGATKRMCEMMVQSASTYGKVKYSATRFGNVLGSAGSVIPLFKRQIAAGGPVTVTDKRIIRYFMTIPEAAQLVLQSGAMARNGELFVLDMGKPIKILDLAENMIHLSGVPDIEIVETGLRPGEKLYEELLVNSEELDKTENDLIFIERDTPLQQEDIEKRLKNLHNACATGNDEKVRVALRKAVPTYKTPEEVNAKAESSKEMKNKRQLTRV